MIFGQLRAVINPLLDRGGEISRVFRAGIACDCFECHFTAPAPIGNGEGISDHSIVWHVGPLVKYSGNSPANPVV